jgi:ParB-like chromosome segregation protein Spo0J
MNIKNKLKTVDISDIKPYKNNAKKHSKDQIELIKESLNKNDYYSPIGIDKNNVIVVGHGRYEALRQMDPNQKIEVVDFSYLKPKEIKKLRILDNKIVSDEWDKDLLEAEINSIYNDLECDIEKAIKELNLQDDDIIMPKEAEIGLPSGENEFEQITFTLSTRQGEIVRDAIKNHIGINDAEDNENKNGNALEAICQKSM